MRQPAYDEVVSAAQRLLGPRLKPSGMQSGLPRFNGPCPECGGRDRFRVAQGATAVLIQCNGGCDFPTLLVALGLTDLGEAGPATNSRPEPTVAAPRRNPWLACVWARTTPPDDTPGARYLIDSRTVWLEDRPLPSSVRWLGASAAEELALRRIDWPKSAAGCLVYRLSAPGEAETWALKVEVVTEDGTPIPFNRGGKRPNLSRSQTAGGRRTFHAAGDPDRGIHLVEGPVDALALVTLEALGLVNLGGAAVLGADGVGGFTERACYGRGRVVLYPDGARFSERDNRWIPQAEAKAVRLADELERSGRGFVRIVRQRRGRDLADTMRDAVLERRAIQEG